MGMSLYLYEYGLQELITADRVWKSEELTAFFNIWKKKKILLAAVRL